MRRIYNEGRVVGMSAYEMYVKQQQSIDPYTPPASEKDWLAASFGTGNSQILKLEPSNSNDDESYRVVDFVFPANTDLAAGTTVVASFFDGDVEVDSDGWATKVLSYGDLVENTSDLYEYGYIDIHEDPNAINPSRYTGPSSSTIEAMKNYIKIVDGCIIQPGTWYQSESGSPPSDFTPDLTRRPTLRLGIHGSIQAETCVLFTVLSRRSVLMGISGTDTSTETEEPQNGDFLGPAVYPWANKVIFTMTNNMAAFLESKKEDVPVASISTVKYSGTDANPYGSSNKAKIVEVGSGASSAKAVGIANSLGGSQQTISQKPTSNISVTDTTSNNLTWSTLLEALANDRGIDLLGTRLKSAKASLVQKDGYLEFGSSGIRLYISLSKPTDTDIPEGSIGIGWQED